MNNLQFTHRSDLGPVLALQRKVYHEKVSTCTSARLENLDASAFSFFVKGFQHYRALATLELLNLHCGEDELRELMKAERGGDGDGG